MWVNIRTLKILWVDQELLSKIKGEQEVEVPVNNSNKCVMLKSG